MLTGRVVDQMQGGEVGSLWQTNERTGSFSHCSAVLGSILSGRSTAQFSDALLAPTGMHCKKHEGSRHHSRSLLLGSHRSGKLNS